MFPLPLSCNKPNFSTSLLCGQRCCNTARVPCAAAYCGQRNLLHNLRVKASLAPWRLQSTDSWDSSEGQSWALLQIGAALLATATLVLTPSPSYAAEPMQISGPARVVDGDTLEVGGKKIRLYGLDAPESKQLCRDPAGKEYACGEQITVALRAKIASSPLKCEVRQKDQYSRSVATCSAGDLDVNKWLVDSGFAVAYRQYGTEYVSSEEAAHSAKRGIWGGTFQTPADWRKERKIEQLQQSLAKSGDQGLPPVRVVKGPSDFQLDPQECSTPTVGGRITAFCARLLGRNSTAAPEIAPAAETPSLGSGSKSKASSQAILAALSSSAKTGTGPPSPECVIKGNISPNGKVYHVPGGAAYDRTQIVASEGERWFCNEQEAEAAGWRKAKQ